MAKLLDGTSASKQILKSIKSEIINSGRDIPPRICIILVGNNSSSETYVKAKIKACLYCGFREDLVRYESDVSEKEILDFIEECNLNKEIDGVIVQLPLPSHIDYNKIICSISPEKDIDGFNPVNFGKMALGQRSFRPATAYGICKLLEFYNIETNGKHCVVIGRSNIVGKPISIMLGNNFNIGNATVTSTHINTPRSLLLSQLLVADIVIVAVGIPNFLTGDMVKEGVVVIDVGINRIDNKLVGDVEWKTVHPKSSWITPVPGGVGPMTITGLIINTLTSWNNKY